MTQKLSSAPSEDEIVRHHGELIPRVLMLTLHRKAMQLTLDQRIKLDPAIIELAKQMELHEQEFARVSLLKRLKRCQQTHLNSLAGIQRGVEKLLESAENLLKEIREECETVIDPDTLN